MEIRILKRLSYKYCNVEIEANGVTKEGYSKAVELVDYAIDSEFQKLKAYVDENGEKVEPKPVYQPKPQYNNYQKPQYPANAPNNNPPSEAQIKLLRTLKVSEEQIAGISTSTEASALIQQVKGGVTPQPQPQYQAPVQQQAQQVQSIKAKANPFDM